MPESSRSGSLVQPPQHSPINAMDVRVDLVVAHRLTSHFGHDELSWNHISGRISKEEYLVTPGDKHYDMLQQEDLVG
jgi:ribulose-5-phosphate 4-epimerase/fuculose-1-phosphate aldolase